MAREDGENTREGTRDGSDPESEEPLLPPVPIVDDDDAEDIPPIPPPKPKPRPEPLRRQSSLAQQRPNGTPRTPNRVRFDLAPPGIPGGFANGEDEHTWMEEDDPLSDDPTYANGHLESPRLSLLTDIQAPSVSLALDDEDFNPEEHLESARPKSGLQNAFMNMANSIM